MKFRLLTKDTVVIHKDILMQLICMCTEYDIAENVREEFARAKTESMLLYLEEGSATVIGAFEDEMLIGVLWAYPVKVIDREAFHVAYVAVLPSHKNMGVGKALIKKAEEITKERGYCSLELHVSSNNLNAIGFYNKNGFETYRLTMMKQL